MLILVTPTYNKPGRLSLLKNLSIMIGSLKDTKWIIVEDNDTIYPEVQNILPENAIYLAHGPTRNGGNAQRNHAYEYIKENKMTGIIYNLDDDNIYHVDIFKELRKVKHVGFLPVGNLGPNGVERPVLNDEGNFIGWDAHWLHRRYCTDMAGFAFNSELLQKLESPLWNFHRHGGGETEFLEKILNDISEAEFLCDNCKTVYVWHNGNAFLPYESF